MLYSHTRIAPWSAGLYRGWRRDVPGSEILNMLKLPGSAGVHPGGRLYRALPCMQAPCWRRDLPCLRRGVPYWRRGVPYLYLCHYTVSLPECTVLAVDLVMDLVETTIFLPDIFSSFSSFRHFLWNCRRCWRFSDQVDNDLKSKKCFLIGIRISPGSTVLTSGWRRGLPCRHRGLPCWHRGVPGSTVFTPVWCQSLSCRYRGLSCWYRGVPGSTVFVPGWRRGLPCLRRGDGPRGDRRCDFIYTLLAKKLCDSSFLNQNLDWINSHFKTDRVMSFIF